MEADDMIWQPTTPPKPFNPYGDGYMPGGWPLDPPTPTAGVSNRPADPGWFLPAAKRVCGGIKTTYDYTAGLVVNAAVKKVQDIRRERRIEQYNRRPLPHLRATPFERAVLHREGIEGKWLLVMRYLSILTASSLRHCCQETEPIQTCNRTGAG